MTSTYFMERDTLSSSSFYLSMENKVLYKHPLHFAGFLFSESIYLPWFFGQKI
jgi:hypothetical protein